MIRSKRKRKFSLECIRETYALHETDTMDEWYKRYLADPTHRWKLGGRIYCKAICIYLLTRGETSQFMVSIDRSLMTGLGDILMDEEVREFAITGAEMLSFRNGIPPWDWHIGNILMTGKTLEIGEYMTPKRTKS